MEIYDTLSKSKKEFTSIKKNKVSFYQCGPTMYWNQHIGNMRSVVLADLIHRSFVYLGNEVVFVRNYTDVGHLSGDNAGDADTGVDRMEKAVKRDGKDPEEIFQYYRDIYEQDIASLNTISPTVTPRATDHVQEMIQMVEILLNKGIAYKTDLAIYFDISKQEDYTKLSGQDMSKLLSGTAWLAY